MILPENSYTLKKIIQLFAFTKVFFNKKIFFVKKTSS